MNRILQNFFVFLAILSFITLGTSCGSKETDETAKPQAADESAGGPAGLARQAAEPAEGTSGTSEQTSKAASFKEAFKAAAATEGIFFGEVPEGFPLDFLPLYPGGEIDKSSLKDGEATLLQVVSDPKDKVFAHYRDFYTKLGWTAGDPMTVMDRTMVGFSGNGGQVDMTMINREGGKLFVALALH
jgi:hypothetical protein